MGLTGRHAKQIHAEKSPFLTERLRVWMLPTLALVKLGKTVDYVVGFAELGGSDDFGTDVLAARCAGSAKRQYHISKSEFEAMMG